MANTRSDPVIAPGLTRNAHWLLRAALATVFIFHGLDKFLGGGITGFAQGMGLPPQVALLVAVGELGAGTFMLLGGLIAERSGGTITRLGAIGMIVILLGAIFMAHWGQWHFMPTATHPVGGMEFQVTLAFMSAYMLIKGNEV